MEESLLKKQIIDPLRGSQFAAHLKIILMAKYSKKAQEKVEKVMHEKKKGTLRRNCIWLHCQP